MSINKSISYILYNKGIIVNLYKLHFLSFIFSLQSNKRGFHPSTFQSLQPNTQKGKSYILYSPTFPSSHNFLFFYFFTPPTEGTLSLRTTECFIVKTIHWYTATTPILY